MTSRIRPFSAAGRSALHAGASLVLSCAAAFAQAPIEPSIPEAHLPPARTPLDAADEQTEQYLDQMGLHSLLAEHLERKLTRATGTRRIELADRLAEVYAQVLGTTEDFAEQSRIEAKARDLLASVPEADSVELRLGLARAGYARLERIAERRRIRAAAPDEAAAAARRFDELESQFAQIASDAHSRVQSLERQEASARSDQNLVATALSGVLRQRQMAHYLAAWCGYYAAELQPEGRDDSTIRALKHLSWLLGSQRPGLEPPQITDTRPEMLKFEHVARSAVAAALCLSLRGQTDDAGRWLDIVDAAPDAAEVVKSQVPSRRMVVLARGARWDALRQLVDSHRTPPVDQTPGAPTPPANPAPVPLDPVEARLLAVLTLETASPTPTTRALTDLAVSDLLARGESGAVLELASEFGVAKFASTGFVGHQVRGLQLYDQARTAHGARGPTNEPSADPEAIRLYTSAGEQFRLALESADRTAFPGAIGGTRMILGLCWFSAGGGADGASALARAAEWFDAAASALTDPAQRNEAMWMAIRALDLHLSRAGLPERGAAARRDELIDRFIREAPDGERTTALIVRRASSRAQATPQEVARLLAVPDTDPQFLASRRQAARMAYQLFRAVPGGQTASRDSASLRYIEIAEPLLALERRRAPNDPIAASNAAAHARQIMDALLSTTSPDPDRAERALDVLMGLAGANLYDTSPITSELALRRMQIALARGQSDAAEQQLNELREKDPQTGAIGDRMVFAARHREFRRLRSALESGAPGVTRDTAGTSARAAFEVARRLLAAESAESRLADRQSVTLHTAAAELGAFVWEAAGDAQARDLALALYRVLARKQPNIRAFVRGVAELADAAGETDESLQAWSSIVSASEPGSQPWFEARFRLASVLAKARPAEALELLNQHAGLYPDYGPAPWGEKLRALHQSLRGPGSAAPKGGAL